MTHSLTWETLESKWVERLNEREGRKICVDSRDVASPSRVERGRPIEGQEEEEQAWLEIREEVEIVVSSGNFDVKMLGSCYHYFRYC